MAKKTSAGKAKTGSAGGDSVSSEPTAATPAKPKAKAAATPKKTAAKSAAAKAAPAAKAAAPKAAKAPKAAAKKSEPKAGK